ncbi:hypothetical protein EYF80_040929 [Liparis tanakae]|uniref:Uncharacterized protein n=1 Tax=Liparis tanakae TaxID=230148 RepID=A0A4Z2G7F7_9TELE|nr:hypothetical protein EYF80_040929 [Liparis tanakae]
MALRQTYSSLRSLSSLTLDVAAISMSKISERPWTQFPSSLKTQETLSVSKEEEEEEEGEEEEEEEEGAV